MKVIWKDFKKFIDALDQWEIVRYIDAGSEVFLFYQNSGLSFNCKIKKDSAEWNQFLTYKNKIDDSVAAEGIDRYVSRYPYGRTYYEHGFKKVTSGGTPDPTFVDFFDFKLGTDFEVGSDGYVWLLGGGFVVTTAADDNDYIEFSIIDKDDVLGLFSNYGLTVGQDILELVKYIKNHPVIQDKWFDVNPEQATRLVNGLYLRMTYNAYVTETVTVKGKFYLAK